MIKSIGASRFIFAHQRSKFMRCRFDERIISLVFNACNCITVAYKIPMAIESTHYAIQLATRDQFLTKKIRFSIIHDFTEVKTYKMLKSSLNISVYTFLWSKLIGYRAIIHHFRSVSEIILRISFLVTSHCPIFLISLQPFLLGLGLYLSHTHIQCNAYFWSLHCYHTKYGSIFFFQLAPI